MDMVGGLGPATCGCVQRNVAGDRNALGINSARGKVRVGLGRGRCEQVNSTEPRAIDVDPRPRLKEPIIV